MIRNDWCPGCGNFGILNTVKALLPEINEEVILVAGIGQHAKIVDYLNVPSFYSLHGRAIPAAEGIKLAKPGTKVIVFSGDGDAYGEGIEHLIFAAKRNIDITVVVHNNRVYALTTGQFTPTSPQGFKGRSTPAGSPENPLNPLELMLGSGATFIARGYPVKAEHFKSLLKEAILHKGFSLVDTLQVCFTFFNQYDLYNKKVYELQGHDPADREAALKKMREWDYNSDAPIAIGKFYQVDKPTFEDLFRPGKPKVSREEGIAQVLRSYI
ncbi:MAG: thiamine pyrophosphate-dependent enzyme [Candidatus Margulisiibacteriota bacterium]